MKSIKVKGIKWTIKIKNECPYTSLNRYHILHNYIEQILLFSYFINWFTIIYGLTKVAVTHLPFWKVGLSCDSISLQLSSKSSIKSKFFPLSQRTDLNNLIMYFFKYILEEILFGVKEGVIQIDRFFFFPFLLPFQIKKMSYFLQIFSAVEPPYNKVLQ